MYFNDFIKKKIFLVVMIGSIKCVNFEKYYKFFYDIIYLKVWFFMVEESCMYIKGMKINVCCLLENNNIKE